MTAVGELSCLSAALLWAVSLMLFRGPVRHHGARTVNLFKLWLGTALQGATVLAVGQLGALARSSAEDLLLIAASGVVGLALGDTALFGAVARLGVHRALLLHTLSPVFAAIIAVLWLGELPTASQTLGSLIVLGGVALVVGRREGSGWAAAGIALGVLAALGQGAGLVLAKDAMQRVPVLATSFLRLAAGAVALLLIATLGGRRGRSLSLLIRPSAWSRVAPPTLLGTYLALFLMMFGLSRSPTSVAAVLLSTSPVFSLVLERVVDRKPLTLRSVVGTLLALLGVAVLAVRLR